MVIVTKERIAKITIATVVSFVDVVIIYNSIRLIYLYIGGNMLFLYRVPYSYLVMDIVCGISGLLLSIILVKGKIRVISYILATIFRWFIFFIFSYPH